VYTALQSSSNAHVVNRNHPDYETKRLKDAMKQLGLDNELNPSQRMYPKSQFNGNEPENNKSKISDDGKT
jgi:signal recognition particle subunit SEC65